MLGSRFLTVWQVEYCSWVLYSPAHINTQRNACAPALDGEAYRIDAGLLPRSAKVMFTFHVSRVCVYTRATLCLSTPVFRCQRIRNLGKLQCCFQTRFPPSECPSWYVPFCESSTVVLIRPHHLNIRTIPAPGHSSFLEHFMSQLECVPTFIWHMGQCKCQGREGRRGWVQEDPAG